MRIGDGSFQCRCTHTIALAWSWDIVLTSPDNVGMHGALYSTHHSTTNIGSSNFEISVQNIGYNKNYGKTIIASIRQMAWGHHRFQISPLINSMQTLQMIPAPQDLTIKFDNRSIDYILSLLREDTDQAVTHQPVQFVARTGVILATISYAKVDEEEQVTPIVQAKTALGNALCLQAKASTMILYPATIKVSEESEFDINTLTLSLCIESTKQIPSNHRFKIQKRLSSQESSQAPFDPFQHHRSTTIWL